MSRYFVVLLLIASSLRASDSFAATQCTSELEMLSEFTEGCQKGNASFCDALKETRKNIAALGCKGAADERRQYEGFANGRWSDYMLAGRFGDAAKHADYWAWSLEGREGAGLEQYYRLKQSCLAWGKTADATRKETACNRLRNSRFFEMKHDDPPERQGDEVKRYFAEMERPAKEAQARDQQLREDQETSIKRQQVLGAITDAAQSLDAQRRTNSAIDAQMKADQAKRLAQDRRLRNEGRREASAMAPSERQSNTQAQNVAGSLANEGLSNTSGQMRSGNARDMDKQGETGTASVSTASNEICRCGPDYVQCWVRFAKRTGSRYSSDGRGITFYDSKGLVSSIKGFNADGTCGAIAK